MKKARTYDSHGIYPTALGERDAEILWDVNCKPEGDEEVGVSEMNHAQVWSALEKLEQPK